MACAIPSLLFCCLLLVPHLGNSYHTSYTHGGKHHVVLRSPDDGASPTTFCSDDIPSASGDDGGITAPLPVLHRLSPCSHRAGSGSRSQGMPWAADLLRRDALGLRSLLSVESDSASDVVTVPTTGSPYVDYPGASEYHVVVGYGTPLQRLAVGFDTVSVGLSLLACKPRNGSAWFNTTVVTDKLTLSGSIGMKNFRFACLSMSSRKSRTVDDTPSGILDLSQDSHSLASRAPLSADTVAFSYCLPSLVTTHGFLSIAAARPELSNRSVSYTALRTNPASPNLYFVQLTGITVGGKNIPIPPAGFAGDSLVALRTAFTYLRPDIYAVLREAFVGQMRRYSKRRVAPAGVLDTCYNFAGLPTFIMPAIMLEFDGGAYLYLEIQQSLYLREPNNFFCVVCLAFAAAPVVIIGTGAVAPVAIIGTLAQAKTVRSLWIWLKLR
ncbi:hypothetical protein ACQ4PT_009313 [Festuca glaucescens]